MKVKCSYIYCCVHTVMVGLESGLGAGLGLGLGLEFGSGFRIRDLGLGFRVRV